MAKTMPFPGGATEAADPASEGMPLSAVPRIVRICALGLAIEELLTEACREVAALLGADACHLAAWADEGRRAAIWWFDAPGVPADLRDACRGGPRWESLAGRSGVVAVRDVVDLAPDDPVRAAFEERGARAFLLAPLRFGSSTLGLLAVHQLGAPRTWTPGEVALVAEVAAVLAASLDRRRMEERLRASEARYRFLADHAQDIISLHDPGGRFLYASPAAFRALGYRPEELAGLPLTVFVHPGDRDRVDESTGRLVSGEDRAVTLQYRLVRKDGAIVEAETVASLLPGEARHVLRITRDVTERRRMEARLFESQKMETIGMLAGGMAHEFNNLLAGISGAVEMLNLLLAGNAETARFLEMIGRLSNRATVVTRQLLAYARRGTSSPETVHLNRIVAEEIPVLRAALPGSVEIRTDLCPEVPPVSADLTQIKQVVTALCLNAAEAMPNGGVLTIRTRRDEGPRGNAGEAGPGVPGAEARRGKSVRAPGDVEGTRSVLEVVDKGCGIDPVHLDRIFEPFFTTKFIGRGMGLAAVRGIVENHGGEIGVRSEVGKGTAVSVAFPAAAAAGTEGEARGTLPLCGTGVVLVADDEDDVRTVVRAMLESFGYEVLEARDGREAVEIFAERRERVDLVLLDLMMPRMTGEEAFAAMRRIDPSVRGILASGYDESGRIGEIVAAGFRSFLQKPFRRRELGQRVAEALGRGGRPAGSPPREGSRDGA